jgi:hypothetical protein
MQSRNPDCAVALTEDLCLPRRELIALVKHQNHRKPIESEALKHGIHGRDMGIQISRPCIDHVEEKVGIA